MERITSRKLVCVACISCVIGLLVCFREVFVFRGNIRADFIFHPRTDVNPSSKSDIIFASKKHGRNDIQTGGTLIPDKKQGATIERKDGLPLYIQGHNNKNCEPLPRQFPHTTSFFHCDFRTKPPSICSYRLRAELSCNKSSAEILYKWVQLDSPPLVYKYEDPCLARVIAEKCTRAGLIPKVMHYVNFNRRQIPFFSVLSVLSAARTVQPCLVLFLGDYLPYGTYWEALVQLVPNIIHVRREQPTSIFGNKIDVIEHKADVARLEAMIKFGGIYSDMDHIVLNPLDNLLHHPVVMGIEDFNKNFNNGFFLAQAGAPFLKLWYDAYHTFNDKQWGEHSCFVPYRLQHQHPDMVHVEWCFFRPTNVSENIRNDHHRYNWGKLYGTHLYGAKTHFVGSVVDKRGSYGEITRRVLFGSIDACMSDSKHFDAVLLPNVSDS